MIPETIVEVSMRHPWLFTVLLALAAIGGYAAGTTPVQAQADGLPFQVGDVVALSFQDKVQRQCRIAEVRGMFARCGDAADIQRFGIARREPPEDWVNMAVVEGVTRSRDQR
jgi:hypothetical protein